MANQTKSKLKFAALRRVSTEPQKVKGESLETQKKQLTDYVANLGGEITAFYGGQEHATEGYEKVELDRLLQDAAKKKFNAVIVCDADRWSRDNEKSKKGLRILRDSNIRFFTGSMECDLFNPAHVLYLGMAAEIGEFQAATSKAKSHINRLERAKTGRPTAGKLPFGRTFDKETGRWDLIPEKAAMIKDVAKRYLAGESMLIIANEYNIHHTILARVLKKRCGDKWVQNFYKSRLDADGKRIKILIDTIEFTIPRLLSAATIKAVHERSKSNRTLHHGDYKHKYLLGRMVFCSSCGYVMNSTTISKYSYFRHPKNIVCKCGRPAGCNQISQAKFEKTVLAYLYDMFGNKAMIEQAINAAIPNKEQVAEDREQLTRIEKELKKLQAARDKFIEAIGSGILSDDEMHKQHEIYTKKKERLNTSKIQLNEKLASVPDIQEVKSLGTLRRQIAKKPLDEMSYSEKKALLRMVFSGKQLNGKRQGIYINWIDPKHYTFNIHGQLFAEKDLISMDDKRREAVFDSNNPLHLEKLHTIKPFHFLLSGTSKKTGSK